MTLYMALFSYKNMIEGQGGIITKKQKTEYETKLKLQERLRFTCMYVVKMNPILLAKNNVSSVSIEQFAWQRNIIYRYNQSLSLSYIPISRSNFHCEQHTSTQNTFSGSVKNVMFVSFDHTHLDRIK